jgi:anti-sigma factor RsiW
MDHQQAIDLLAAYLDDEATSEERVQIEAHLAGCRDCRRELEALRTEQSALREALRVKASDAIPPPQAWSQLQLGIQDERPSFLFLFRKRKWRILATVVVLLIVATLAALWLTGVLPGLR